MINIYILEQGVGVSDGKAVAASETVDIVFHGAPVDSVFVNERSYPVVKGRATIRTDGLAGLVNVTARNSVTRRAYLCDKLLFLDGHIIPMQRFTPAEYVVMTEAAMAAVKAVQTKIEKLEAAVYGIPLFGKETEK